MRRVKSTHIVGRIRTCLGRTIIVIFHAKHHIFRQFPVQSDQGPDFGMIPSHSLMLQRVKVSLFFDRSRKNLHVVVLLTADDERHTEVLKKSCGEGQIGFGRLDNVGELSSQHRTA